MYSLRLAYYKAPGNRAWHFFYVPKTKLFASSVLLHGVLIKKSERVSQSESDIFIGTHTASLILNLRVYCKFPTGAGLLESRH